MIMRDIIAMCGMSRNHLRQIGTLLAAGLLAGCMATADGDPADWYAAQNVQVPQGRTVFICHATDCAQRVKVHLGAQDMARLQRILAAGSGSARAERAAISRAVQWFERRVGPIVGSSDDVGGFDFSTVNMPGQMDCIDEATNTTTLLKLAANNRFLKHHRVGRPAARGFFLDGRYPHATAVVIETANGAAWAVDSWIRDNGERPDIMPLDQWMRQRTPWG